MLVPICNMLVPILQHFNKNVILKEEFVRHMYMIFKIITKLASTTQIET